MSEEFCPECHQVGWLISSKRGESFERLGRSVEIKFKTESIISRKLKNGFRLFYAIYTITIPSLSKTRHLASETRCLAIKTR